MYKIKPTIFTITKEEIEETAKEMIKGGILEANFKLSRKQITHVLECVECDELLAKDIHMSIKNSIREILFA